MKRLREEIKGADSAKGRNKIHEGGNNMGRMEKYGRNQKAQKAKKEKKVNGKNKRCRKC